jgi:hypothetical protein
MQVLASSVEKHDYKNLAICVISFGLEKVPQEQP